MADELKGGRNGISTTTTKSSEKSKREDHETEYNASSIVILSAAVAASKFGYQKAVELRETFPMIPMAMATTLVEASQLTNIDPELVFLKYGQGDKTIVLPVEFDEIYRSLLSERSRR